MRKTSATIAAVACAALALCVSAFGTDAQTMPTAGQYYPPGTTIPTSAQGVEQVGIDSATGLRCMVGETATCQVPVSLGSGTGSNVNIAGVNGAPSSATNPLYVGPATGAVFTINTGQIGGVSVLTGAGATGAGSERVTVAQDATTIAGAPPGTAGAPSASVISTQGVANGTPLNVSPAPTLDGQAVIASHNQPLYADGAALETASASLGAANANTGPLAMQGYASQNLTMTGTWSGTITFQANPLLDSYGGSGTWVSALCVPLGGGTPVSTITVNGSWQCQRDGPNGIGSAPIRAIMTTYASGTATVTPTKSGANAQTGFPVIASQAAWNANVINTNYAGLSLGAVTTSPIPTLTLVCSTLVSEAVNGVCGRGPTFAHDQSGVANTYSYYTEANTSNCCSYTAFAYDSTSPVNPYSASGTDVVCTMGYDSTNSRWYGCNFQMNPSTDFYKVTGVSVPPTGSYWEFDVQFPASSALAGTCIWLGPYESSAGNYANQTGPFNLNSTTQGHMEHDPMESCTLQFPYGSGATYSFAYGVSHTHEFNVDGGNPNQPGVPQTERSTASGQFLNPWNDAAGNHHLGGVLNTPDYWCSMLDRVVVNCTLKIQGLDNLGLMTPKLLMVFGQAPTAATTLTVPVHIKSFRYYTFNAAALPVPLVGLPQGGAVFTPIVGPLPVN
jgi:hypothetical protein